MADVSVGAGLRYKESGVGLPTLLLHGFPFDSRIWANQLEALSGSARIIALDLPGFGASPAIDQDEPTIEGHARAIARFVEVLRLGKVVLVGHSMAGYISLAFARLYPEALAGLVLVATKPGADTPKARQSRYRLIEKVEQEGANAVVDAMHERLFAPGGVERHPRAATLVREVMSSQTSSAIIAALQAMASRPSSTPNLSKIAVPTLAVAGTRDVIIPARTMRDMTSRIPGAKYISMRGAGHMPMLEKPQEFNRALQSFLREIEAR